MHGAYKIIGGNELSGTIGVKGAKNAALKIMAACLLSEEPCRVIGLPELEDVKRMSELLKSIGVQITEAGTETIFDTSHISHTKLDDKLVSKIRTSILLAGPLVARSQEVWLPYPGGCNIGQRPIDMFIAGWQTLGIKVDEEEDGYRLRAKKITGGKIVLPRISHTVTESLMMTAVLAEGQTVIGNAAMEPEIVALADYLNSQGAKVSGAGTPTITITGVDKIHGGTYRIMPDRLETATFTMLGLLTNSEINITDCDTSHLENLWWHLRQAGAKLEIGPDFVTTKPSGVLKATNITTHEYPGFVTDFQAPYTVLMTQAQGLSLIHETIFEGRLFYTDLLNSMGANIIMCDPHRVVVNGPTKLRGRYLTSPDLRAGIALVLAGLVAQGHTTIDNIYQVERGYEKVPERLAALGAKITRTDSAN
jgi:UDP-N-acetylglucosamine 1-carboxyvinyltransferase